MSRWTPYVKDIMEVCHVLLMYVLVLDLGELGA